MSVTDFYNAVTPGSHLQHGSGSGVYNVISEEDIHSKELLSKVRVPTNTYSILNQIPDEGMITYIDFVFLSNILTTPRRYIDIAFHIFDVSADGEIEAKVKKQFLF